MWRLAHEPRRLAGRYLLGNPEFLARGPAWLDPRLTETSAFDELIADGDRPGLVATAVDRRVNDARNEGPDLVRPLATPGGLA